MQFSLRTTFFFCAVNPGLSRSATRSQACQMTVPITHSPNRPIVAPLASAAVAR